VNKLVTFALQIIAACCVMGRIFANVGTKPFLLGSVIHVCRKYISHVGSFLGIPYRKIWFQQTVFLYFSIIPGKKTKKIIVFDCFKVFFTFLQQPFINILGWILKIQNKANVYFFAI
jgi:hypothetical protein